ncbi:hypothetical protein DFH07DRAFT_796539 [Mycena maculata]|uniref:Yeast cell wall synthesis Kre9/Knh1-like N-terminal domain-containing protein n=1 Tax=Mycena maculata TaxID=230809 RepID=A0AAD7K3Z5_9AGAR|nr:hypothetical protein DFH07DRAFT_796539 [Mycena maculata]
MYSSWILATFVALDLARFASAGLYFIEPANGSTCTGGSPCTIDWLDDGNAPLLNLIGTVTCGLYTGNQQLVQTIQPVDVSSIHSVQFTPNAEAGPNSGSYYIAFTSTSATVNGTKYIAFSPFFNLNGMSGSFSSPLAAATSTIPIPSSLTRQSSSDTVGTTIIVGSSLDTSLPPLTTSSAVKPPSSSSSSLSSRFTTSPIPTSSSTSVSHSSSFSSGFTISSIPTSSPSAPATNSANSPSPTAASSNAATSRPLSLPVLAVLSLWLAVSSFS